MEQTLFGSANRLASVAQSSVEVNPVGGLLQTVTVRLKNLNGKSVGRRAVAVYLSDVNGEPVGDGLTMNLPALAMSRFGIAVVNDEGEGTITFNNSGNSESVQDYVAVIFPDGVLVSSDTLNLPADNQL